MGILAERVKSPKWRASNGSMAAAAPLIFTIIGCTLLLQTAEAANTQFVVTNTALQNGEEGGTRFDTDFGNAQAISVLQSAKSFCLTSFSLSPEISISTFTLFVDDTVPSGDVAVTSSSNGQAETHLSASYVATVDQGNTSAFVIEITGVLYHESTHVWQNSNGSYGSDKYFTGIIEGIADYIRLTSGFPASTWVKQAGGNWYDGYSTTAYFLDWIEQSVFSNFVNQLNAKMADPWTNDFFYDITGQTVDQLWNSYQASF